MKLVGMHNNEMVLDTSLCPKEKNYEWSFIQCPGNKDIMKIISQMKKILPYIHLYCVGVILFGIIK